MIATTIAYIGLGAVSAALGYYWGRHDAREAYWRGRDDALVMFRSTLKLLNSKIKVLEEENDLMRIRLGEGITGGAEDEYISQEGGED